MNSVLDKDIVINRLILNQVAKNLRANHEAGVISDARLEELKARGAALASALGGQEQIILNGSGPLSPHVLQAISELGQIDKTLLPEPVFVDIEKKA